jgi:protein ImuB
LAQWCQQFSPLVALEETGPPEDPWPASLLLDVGGTAPRLGGEAALAAELHRGLRALGYTGRLAIADTLGAAWGLARFAQLGPDRTLIAPAGETLPALSRLSIAALRLPPQALERLLRLGITRVEQLISLPRSSLRSRLGPEVLQRVDQALGTASETLSSQVPMADFSASWDSVSPLESTELIQRILDRLCGQVASQLSQRRLGAVRLLCRLTDSTGNSQRLEVGFFQPTSQTARWQEVLALPIERLHPTHGIARIELLAHPTEPLAQHQRDLFASRQESAGERPQELAWGRLVERLAGRLGHHAVVRPRQVAHAQPELALGWDPVVGPGGGAARSPRGKHSAATLSPGKSGPGKSGPGKSSLANERCHHPLQRPLLLLRTAIALPTSGGTPTSPPQQFRWQGQWEMIVRHWGPERIETGWWRRPGIRRDYWRVETATGRRWWIYRDLSQPPTSQASWFLHGEFA